MSRLLLTKDIYNKQDILVAREAFSGICVIIFLENSEYWICEFKNSIYDANITMKEFENYIIDLVNTRNME